MIDWIKWRIEQWISDFRFRNKCIAKAEADYMYVGPYWDYSYHLKATYEFVQGFYDRAFGDLQDEFYSLRDTEDDKKMKEHLELVLGVLDKWVNGKYTLAEEQKSCEELVEAYRLLSKWIPYMWD